MPPLPKLTPVPPQSQPQQGPLPSISSPPAIATFQVPVTEVFGVYPSGPSLPPNFRYALMKVGTTVVTLNASGDGTLVFAIPFPHGLITAFIMNGDQSVQPGAVFAVFTSSGNGGVSFAVTPNPGAISIRINVIAFGW